MEGKRRNGTAPFKGGFVLIFITYGSLVHIQAPFHPALLGQKQSSKWTLSISFNRINALKPFDNILSPISLLI